jgi:hypothetical protein
MPTTVHKSLASSDHMTSALKTVQSFTSQTVRVAIDDQMRAAEIIKLQTFLSTQSATNPPSNKKFDPAKINRDIMDQDLQGRIIDVQNAANLT